MKPTMWVCHSITPGNTVMNQFYIFARLKIDIPVVARCLPHEPNLIMTLAEAKRWDIWATACFQTEKD